MYSLIGTIFHNMLGSLLSLNARQFHAYNKLQRHVYIMYGGKRMYTYVWMHPLRAHALDVDTNSHFESKPLKFKNFSDKRLMNG